MGWKRGVFFRAIAIIALFLVVILAVFSNRTFDQNKSGTAECRTNADCVKVQTTCCSCSMGGTETCVLVSNVSVYKPKNCPPANQLMCIAMYACQIKSCACVQGKCEAVPLKE